MPTNTANVIQKNVTLVALAMGGRREEAVWLLLIFFPQEDWEEKTNNRRLPPQRNLDLCHLNLLSVVE